MIQIHEFFSLLSDTNIFFWFENKGAQLFLIRVLFWILILKLSCVLRGEIDVSLENNFWLMEYFWATFHKHSQIDEKSFLYLLM
mgnify:CR=1 FL=1